VDLPKVYKVLVIYRTQKV